MIYMYMERMTRISNSDLLSTFIDLFKIAIIKGNIYVS